MRAAIRGLAVALPWRRAPAGALAGAPLLWLCSPFLSPPRSLAFFPASSLPEPASFTVRLARLLAFLAHPSRARNSPRRATCPRAPSPVSQHLLTIVLLPLAPFVALLRLFDASVALSRPAPLASPHVFSHASRLRQTRFVRRPFTLARRPPALLSAPDSHGPLNLALALLPPRDRTTTQMKFTISAVAVSALALASSAAAQVTINTPPPLYTCQNALLCASLLP